MRRDTRSFWGVEFHRGGDNIAPLYGSWHPALQFSRYDGEPTRVVAFTTRRQARVFCAEQNLQWRRRSDYASQWYFRVIRVREVVEVLA